MLEFKCQKCNEVRLRFSGNATIRGSGVLRCRKCGDDLAQAVISDDSGEDYFDGPLTLSVGESQGEGQ